MRRKIHQGPVTVLNFARAEVELGGVGFKDDPGTAGVRFVPENAERVL
jgi:hypothetical protein